MTKIFLLAVGIGVIALLASTNPQIVSADAMVDSEPVEGIEHVTLSIDGMTCRSCVKPLRKALLQISGVKKARVSYSAAQAIVECEKGKVTDGQLVRAIEDQSGFFYTYKASVVKRE